MAELNEQEFITYFEQTTGRKLGVDFGFIAGTHHPYKVQGMQSANNFPGFKVWHKVGDKTYELNCYPTDQVSILEYVKNFINFTFINPDKYQGYLSQKGFMIIDANKTE